MKFDYLIVGTGLFGAVFAYEMTKHNKRCLLIDKRPHIGGNAYCENIDGIQVHKYGAHIFHTDDIKIWEYVNKFATFNNYVNSPLANYYGKLYNLPFNMNTFYKLWGTKTPEEARNKIAEQTSAIKIDKPRNLEEQAIKMVGPEIYYKLIKHYTEKQWGRKATELPPSIIKRLPIRFTFDNNYFNDRYQGIPIGGYNVIIDKLIKTSEVRLDTCYFNNRDYFDRVARKIVFTGKIDEFFDFKFGDLEYRSLKFETEIYPMENYQGNAVINFTDRETPFTRIYEHKHFDFGDQPHTVITKEYPIISSRKSDPFYPVNDTKNMNKYKKYQQLVSGRSNVIFGGRLGTYRYYDMHQVIASALKTVKSELKV